ncbi:MAG: hypothetical protein NZ942_03710, partial [Candidatus Aenigmarchaeota archaeon]|nr:hypothetical protein [Candidatus Aenigmarchaeota archaeon]
MSFGKNEVKLIESTLPVDLLSRDAAIEMSFKSRSAYYARCKELGIKPPSSFYDPKIRNIHPWLARRSCSISRALNLAALLPKESANEFLNLIGFTEEELKRLVSQGYPPLVFYTRPQTHEADFREEKVLDPMAGGGAIPLESLTLGIETIACEYNPVAFLLLKATVEFPAKYGFKLYQRVREEAFLLISYLQEKLKSFYEKDVEGYIFLRKVLVDGEEIPLTSLIPLTPKEYVSIGGKGVTIQKGRASLVCDKSLLPYWMRQQVQIMKEKNTELLDVVHKCLLVKTKRGFRLANEADQQLLRKAYDEYWKFKSFLPDVLLPEDNEVFKDILPLERYLNLFNPRQALALGLATEYVRKKT